MGCLKTKIQADNATKVKRVLWAKWSTFVEYPTTFNGRIWLIWNDANMEVTVLTTTIFFNTFQGYLVCMPT